MKKRASRLELMGFAMWAILTMFAFYAFIFIGCSGDDTTTNSTVIECIGHPHEYKHVCHPCELNHCDEWIPPGQRGK